MGSQWYQQNVEIPSIGGAGPLTTPQLPWLSIGAHRPGMWGMPYLGPQVAKSDDTRGWEHHSDHGLHAGMLKS